MGMGLILVRVSQESLTQYLDRLYSEDNYNEMEILLALQTFRFIALISLVVRSPPAATTHPHGSNPRSI